MKAVILAAGLGTRLRPLTDEIPKALVPVVNRPAILRVADRLRAAGVRTFCVNLHPRPDLVRNVLKAEIEDLHVAVEPVLLDSGGGVKHFEALLTEDFLVHNCDVETDLDLVALMDEHRSTGAAATLALVPHPPTDKVRCTPDGLVTAFGPPGEGLTYSGLAALSPEVLRHARPHSSLRDAFEALMAEGRPVRAWQQEGARWHDFGTVASYLDLHRDLLRDRWEIHPEARVEPGCRLEGWGCAGAGARLSGTLRNAVIWPGVRVNGEHSDCIIGLFGVARP